MPSVRVRRQCSDFIGTARVHTGANSGVGSFDQHETLLGQSESHPAVAEQVGHPVPVLIDRDGVLRVCRDVGALGAVLAQPALTDEVGLQARCLAGGDRGPAEDQQVVSRGAVEVSPGALQATLDDCRADEEVVGALGPAVAGELVDERGGDEGVARWC